MPEVNFILEEDKSYYYGDTISVEIISNYLNSDNIYFVEPTDSNRFITSYQSQLSNDIKVCKVYLDSTFTYDSIQLTIKNDIFNYEYKEAVGLNIKKFNFASKLEYSDVYVNNDTLKIDLTEEIIGISELYIDEVKLSNPTKIHDSLYYFIVPEIDISGKINSEKSLKLNYGNQIFEIATFMYYEKLGYFKSLSVDLLNFRIRKSENVYDFLNGGSSRVDTLITDLVYIGSSGGYSENNCYVRYSNGIFKEILMNRYNYGGEYGPWSTSELIIKNLDLMNFNYIPNQNNYELIIHENNILEQLDLTLKSESSYRDNNRGDGGSSKIKFISYTDSSSIKITLSR